MPQDAYYHALPDSPIGEGAGWAPISPELSDPVINLQAAFLRMGGNAGLLHDIAGFFVEDAPALLGRIRRSLIEGDAATVAHAAHTLKGLASNFDAHRVERLSSEVEQLGRGGDLRHVEARLNELEWEVHRVHEELEAELLHPEDRPA